MEEHHKNLIMFYQTTLRNVGLYTSISFGALGYSRYYRGKSSLYNISLLAISILFLVIAGTINYYLIFDMNSLLQAYDDESLSEYLTKWSIIPKGVIVIQFILLFLAIYTLYNEVRQ